MKKCKLLILIMILCLVPLSACKKEEEPLEHSPVIETVADVREPTETRLPYNRNASYDPLSTTDIYNFQLIPLIYDVLFTVDESFKAQTSLVEEYSFDGLTMTLSIRKDVYFHDGAPLTSKDVLYTLNAIKSLPKSNFSKRVANVATVIALDEYRVELTLHSANMLFPSLLNIPIVKEGEKDESFEFIGSGKYAFDAENSKLVPNGLWFGEKAQKDIPLINVPDEDAANFAFNTGELTVLTTPKLKSGQSNLTYVTNNLVFLGVNTKRPILSDKNIRIALSSAISRTKIVDNNMQEGGFVALSPINTKWFLYDLSKQVYGHDVNVAMNLLAEAGYAQKNEAGILFKEETANKKITNRPLTLRLLASKGNYDKKSLADTIAYVLRETGIEIIVEEESYQRYIQRLGAGDFDLYLGEIKMLADMDFSILFGSTGALNYGRYSSAAMDTALANLRKEGSREAVSALIEIMSSEMPIIPLFYKMGAVATSSDIKPLPNAQNQLSGL